MIVVWGGGVRGAYGAGQQAALWKMGLMQLFRWGIGNSAGSADLIYGLSGEKQNAIGSSLYSEDCTTKDFFNLARIWKMMQVGFIAKKMSHGKKAVDLEALLQKSQTDFYVIAVNVETGNAELINAKTVKEGPIEAVRASMAVPIVNGDQVSLTNADGNKTKYSDGSFGVPVTFREIIKKFNPTDILFLSNSPQGADLTVSPTADMLAEASMRASTISSLRPFAPMEKLIRSQKVLQEMYDEVQNIQKETGVHIGVVLPPDGGLSTTEQNNVKIGRAMWKAGQDIFERFGWKGNKDVESYHSN